MILIMFLKAEPLKMQPPKSPTWGTYPVNLDGFKPPIWGGWGVDLTGKGVGGLRGIADQLQISALLRFISPSKNILAIFSK